MQYYYKREASHTFFVVRSEEETDPDSFPVKVLCGGIIPGMLKCYLRNMDGKNELCYDATACRTLRSAYEGRKLNFPDVRFILEGCVGIIEEMEEYLLPPNHLLLSPDSIFVNPERTALFFCCLPGAGREIQDQLREMAEYTIKEINHSDKEAMAAGYGFYRQVCDGSVPMDQLRKAIYTPDPEMEMEPGRDEDHSGRMRHESQDDADAFFDESFVREGYEPYEEETKRKGIRAKLIPAVCLTGAAALSAVFLGILHAGGRNRAVPVEKLMAVLLVCMAAGALIWSIVSRKRADKKEKASEKQEEYAFAEELPDDQDSDGLYTDLSMFRGYKGDVSDNTEMEYSKEKKKIKSHYVLNPENTAFPVIMPSGRVTIIGSLAGAADVILRSAAVSRVHAKIYREKESLYLEDLHSRNGTTINGRLLSEEDGYRLQEGDTVFFADVEYTVVGQRDVSG